MRVYNISWVDEHGNEEQGTALFAYRELAEAWIKQMLEPMQDGNTYSVNELSVVTEL